jgi:hypothetical protein
MSRGKGQSSKETKRNRDEFYSCEMGELSLSAFGRTIITLDVVDVGFNYIWTFANAMFVKRSLRSNRNIGQLIR